MIVKAAIKRGSEVIVGTRHCDCIRIAVNNAKWMPPITQKEQGFINDKGEFLSRQEAAKEAFECGQVKELNDSLISEQLW